MLLTGLDINSGTTNSPEWCIRVDAQNDPSHQFNGQRIGELFQGCVGAVLGTAEYFESGRKWIKVALAGEDDLKKALCMSGYTIGDTSIQVTSLSDRPCPPFPKSKSKHALKSKHELNTRRNLYVLNVPHDLSPQAYRDLFTPHGTPTHTVLLKTHDSCSRRRGFVVMSTHEEANSVIRWLDGICISGFQLRVTWANIDRSNGFMSGYDRTTFLGQNDSPSPGYPVSVQLHGIPMDTTTVVASNIPISLFPDHEIDSLFKPFGFVKNIQLIPPNTPLDDPLSTLAPASLLAQTAIVTYENAADAIAAKTTLHGQVYAGFTLAVGFVSKLGREDPCISVASVSSLATKLPLSVQNSTPFCAVGHTHTVPPSLASKKNGGLPTPLDLYNIPLQPQYETGFFHSNPNLNGWTSHSFLPPPQICQKSQHPFRVASRYELGPTCLHYRYPCASRLTLRPNISGVPWGVKNWF